MLDIAQTPDVISMHNAQTYICMWTILLNYLSIFRPTLYTSEVFEYTSTLLSWCKALPVKWSVHAITPLNCIYNFINDIKSVSSPWKNTLASHTAILKGFKICDFCWYLLYWVLYKAFFNKVNCYMTNSSSTIIICCLCLTTGVLV